MSTDTEFWAVDGQPVEFPPQTGALRLADLVLEAAKLTVDANEARKTARDTRKKCNSAVAALQDELKRIHSANTVPAARKAPEQKKPTVEDYHHYAAQTSQLYREYATRFPERGAQLKALFDSGIEGFRPYVEALMAESPYCTFDDAMRAWAYQMKRGAYATCFCGDNLRFRVTRGA